MGRVDTCDHCGFDRVLGRKKLCEGCDAYLLGVEAAKNDAAVKVAAIEATLAEVREVKNAWRSRAISRRLAIAAMKQALGALSRQVEARIADGVLWLPDHACAECVPGSELLVAGFRCGRHAALAALVSP